MSTPQQIPARDAVLLKTASKLLTDKLGGIAASAALLKYPPSRMSESCSEFHDDRWLNLLQVADLECAASDPVITRALAEMAGFDLVERQPQVKLSLARVMAAITVECNEVQTALAVAMDDGELSKAERRNIDAQANQAIAALQALQAQVRQS